MDKQLFLIRGLPGSGKSTLAYMMREWYWQLGVNAEHHEADTYHYTPDGYYVFDPVNVPFAHKRCQQDVKFSMAPDDDDFKPTNIIIVSNTFTRQWEMEPYRELAREHGYRVTEIAVKGDWTDAELAARNVHSVPVEVIAQMRARWED